MVYQCIEVANNVCSRWQEMSSVLYLEKGQGIAVGMQFLGLSALLYCVGLFFKFYQKG